MEEFLGLPAQGEHALLDYLPDGVFVIDEGNLTYVNRRLADMLGYSLDGIIGQPFIGFIATEDQCLAWEMHRARLAGEKVVDQYYIHLLSAQGQLIFCAINVSLIQSPQGRFATIGSVRDVSQTNSVLADIERSKMELKSIFEQLPDVFYRSNMQGIITMISPSCFDVLGYRQHEMLGVAMAQFYDTPEDRQKVVLAITEGGGKATRVEAGLRHKNGDVVWISTNAFIRFDSNHQPISVDGVARDNSASKKLENELISLSRIDGLTEVYNRKYFMDKTRESISQIMRYHRPATFLMMDLDQFKKINDMYGHQVGDATLTAFSQACREEIRETDVLGRLGGEEFALFLPETALPQALVLAERIRAATADLKIPFGDQFIRVTVSIGLTELKADELSLSSIMHRADLAMYQAKEKGRNRVVVSH